MPPALSFFNIIELNIDAPFQVVFWAKLMKSISNIFLHYFLTHFEKRYGVTCNKPAKVLAIYCAITPKRFISLKIL